MPVLLIGSTGMGKSTFGNYLIDPDEAHMYDNQTFPIATDNMPMTQDVKVVDKTVQIDGGRDYFIQLIDTPGLNESATKDLSHMIDIIKKVNECEEIRACILVVKFNAKIDAQYRATLNYYSRLFPDLFESNVIIVMTEFKTDEDSNKLRKRQNIDVEQIKRDTVSELCKCSDKKLTYSPQIFTIDCLAIQDAAKEISQNVRRAILDYIFQLQPINVTNLMVAKTDYIQQKDNEKLKELLGEIEGYKERLIEAHKRSEEALNEIHKKELEITKIETKIKNTEEKLNQKDTDEDVIAAQWSMNEEKPVLQFSSKNFSIKSQHEIKSYTTWTNGQCEFEEIDQSYNEVKGTVKGEFIHGTYATVIANTKKRIKYAKEIEDLNKKLEKETQSLTKCKKKRDDDRMTYQRAETEMELLVKYIDMRRSRAKKCQSDLMKIDEAIQRLRELKEFDQSY
uniref:AIG1-type G domain-containing protein n=1 Tax=Amphimedon queenslandica TaxID=400682 RepID=A0A1X7U0P4_AMPQE